MADLTKIEWTHRPGTKGCTWNPIRARRTFEVTVPTNTGDRFARETLMGWYCEHVSEGCRNCYAERLNMKAGDTGGTGLPYKPGHLANGEVEVYLDEKTLLQPLHWRAPRTIFLCSMTDIFGDWVKDEWLDKIFAVAALCPQHTFIMLTKRPGRMRDYINDCGALLGRQHEIRKALNDIADTAKIDDPIFRAQSVLRVSGSREKARWSPLPNVWLGVTAEDDGTAAQRIPFLQDTPASVRFVSYEPAVGPLNLTDLCNGAYFFNALSGTRWHDAPEGVHSHSDTIAAIDWVICGGETGPNARPMHPDWACSLRDQCAAAGVPFFFKQWGEWAPQSLVGAANGCFIGNEFSTEIPWNPGGHPDGCTCVARIGKNAAGRRLDGREHTAWPEARS